MSIEKTDLDIVVFHVNLEIGRPKKSYITVEAQSDIFLF